ncbi:heavy metal translocating P-type ATPase [Ferroplasma acidiphilum]|uniref:heavy metal translocating P-type ATPase n=1 Tax=Ferroplasma acidiphilum TaxID=74969 RepID=UPI002814B830|nr:heavy metal translocating P-type ATPase [Ferroplasma acidiphilum]MCL4348642.1 cadmium-translocating P-type ATPase [Candidatus Thermoplasmatota archaeon]WMT53218.1 MAG: heavy metal translocating P-type ATPase [Ferroplasma acidiphilum]
MAVDPVCGMYVSEDSKIYSDRDGTRYYFCSQGCKDKFDKPDSESKGLKIKLIVAWPFSIAIIVINYLFSFPLKNYVLLLLVLPVQFYVGLDFYKGAYAAIKNKMGNMDLLISLGTLTAFFFSLIITLVPGLFPVKYTYFDASAFIITLLMTGGYIEDLTKKRANSSANALLSLIPDRVHILKEGIAKDIPMENLVAGDIIQIKPGENIPADGTVVDGTSEIDESMLTGEAESVLKAPGSPVTSGTLNLNGVLSVKVTATGKNSTVNKLYSMIQMASMGRAKIQKISDIFSSYFVPIVLAAAFSSALFWYFYLRSVSNPLYSIIAILVFVSVVVIACPCAIGLAAPITLLISSNESSRNGILIKNSSSMDRLSKIDTVIFDKTGTITDNEPEITAFTTTGDKHLAVSLLYSIESGSNHPVAHAIVNYLKDMNPEKLDISEFREIPGSGVYGKYDGKNVEASRAGDHTSLTMDGIELASINLKHKLRSGIENDIKNLQKNHIRVLIVTGDSLENTKDVAEYLHVDKYYYSIKPEGKAEIVKEEQKTGKYVMFVGDGINDTVAMQTADVGVAMASGSDIATATGDIILLNNDLKNILSTLIIGKYTIKKIKQNVGWAIGYNSALIPVAAGILTPLLGLGIYYVLPIFAALAMGLSSTTVVLNSMQLRKHMERKIAMASM